jgi:septum formation protein
MPSLVLASASPRRRELFALLGLPFVASSADVDEIARAGESPAQLVVRLSATKAATARQNLLESGQLSSDTFVVAADTVVVLDDKILGKPADTTEARQMLRRLRARAHKVYSAVAVTEVSSGRTTIHLDTTTVWMRNYSDAEIEAYVRSGDPLDKAGAYAIQHTGFRPVARLEGCFTGVVGLPLRALVKGLAHFGVTPPVDVAMVCRQWTGHACCLE